MMSDVLGTFMYPAAVLPSSFVACPSGQAGVAHLYVLFIMQHEHFDGRGVLKLSALGGMGASICYIG